MRPGETSAPTSNWLNFTTDEYLTTPSLGSESEAYFYLWMDTEATGIRKIVGVSPIKIYNTSPDNNDDDTEEPANEEKPTNTTKPSNTTNGITTKTDTTTADKDLPKTGKDIMIIAIVAITVCGLVGYIRYKKLDIE